MTPTPIFLLSLPRSGSTLVQRVLARHPDVATAPEPWLLLPQMYALRERGMWAEYVQVSAARALNGFADGLPGGADAYLSEVREFALRLYDRAGGDRRYFVDKTPRYHLIVEDLFRTFPDARFVFLWRNPLAVAASMIETWARGRWSIQRWHVDLFDGLEHLVTAQETHGSGSVTVRYEDLVGSPRPTWDDLFAALDLTLDETYLSDLDSVRVAGRMGDPTGQERYQGLSTEPLERWTRTFSTPVRKRWARGYLGWIGPQRLAAMGYEADTLLAQLEAAPNRVRGTVSDTVHAVGWWADRTGRDRAARLMWRRHPR
jgi:Sulfotransferase family